MHAQLATALYQAHWCPDFTSLDDLLGRIQGLASLGGYCTHVSFDSLSQYASIKNALSELGCHVEDYNGGNNGILEIQWGA